MDRPNQSRFVLALVIVAVCSVWVVAAGRWDANTETVGANATDRLATFSHVEAQPSRPARQSIALSTPNRTAPVLGD